MSLNAIIVIIATGVILSSQQADAININNSGSLQHAIENGDIIDASGKRPVGLGINRLGASYGL